MIVCDCNKKIHCCLAGCPGSCHDNRVHNNTGFVKKPEDHFSLLECNMGDIAFVNSLFMVSLFRKANGQLLEPDHKSPAKLRIHSKHCIGILRQAFLG